MLLVRFLEGRLIQISTQHHHARALAKPRSSSLQQCSSAGGAEAQGDHTRAAAEVDWLAALRPSQGITGGAVLEGVAAGAGAAAGGQACGGWGIGRHTCAG